MEAGHWAWRGRSAGRRCRRRRTPSSRGVQRDGPVCALSAANPTFSVRFPWGRLEQALGGKDNLSRSVIDIVTKIENLKTVPVECHGNDTPLIFHDTPLFSILLLLVHISKFNVHDTPITLPLRLS